MTIPNDPQRQSDIPAFAEQHKRLALTYADPTTYLAELASLEVSGRRERRVRNLIANAHFPAMKTSDAFDFSRQPLISKAAMLQLFDCQFIADGQPVAFLGDGMGKTHCLLAPGLAACWKSYSVAFFSATDLFLHLVTAKRNHILEKELAALDRFDLLAIDELENIPQIREVTEVFFRLVVSRYERQKSVALTAKLPL